MCMKLDRRCPVCSMYLVFVEQRDGVYVMCERCRMAVYMPAETAAEYAANFPTLIELMVKELTELVERRRIKQKRGN
jgi:hypothetical protein